MEQLLLLLLSLFVVTQAAGIATRFSEKLAEGMHFSRYLVGFVVVSFISILPETFIAVDAALRGNPSFGIGTLLGSNVADLTLIFAILIFVAGKHGFHIEKHILRKLAIYPLFLAVPLLLGLDGQFSREEGVTLLIVGIIFYFLVFNRSVGISSRAADIRNHWRNFMMLLFGMALLLVGAHFTVSSALDLAHQFKVPAIVVGVLLVSLGTTIPELFFSAKAVKNKRIDLAVGDILGSVLADATIVIGIVTLITPVEFPRTIAYVAGGFMVAASIVLLILMKTRYRLQRSEAVLLVGVWLLYAVTEILLAHLR